MRYRVFYVGAQSLDRRPRQFRSRHLDGRQRRNGYPGHLNIVEADDRKVVGYAQSGAVDLVQHADRGHVVGTHHCGGQPGGGGQQFLRGGDSAFQRVVAFDDPLRVDGECRTR